MLEFKEQDFEGQVLKSCPKGVVVVVYKATWCKFCAKLQPELPKLSTMLSCQATVATVDYDACKDLIKKNSKIPNGYKVESLPTIIIYKNGGFVSKYMGERKAESIAIVVKKYL